MATANTQGCFKELVGLKVIGVLFQAMPVGRADINRHCTTLVLDDGTGFTFSHSHGSYWRESAEDVQRAIKIKGVELHQLKETIDAWMALAGAGAANSDD